MENNKEKIIIPAGIRYISQWPEYSLRNFEFPHILDKKIPGCGFTEYCITCDIPIVLCSPRRMLLENKEGQHIDDVFYFRNEEFDSVDTSKDLTRIHKGYVEAEYVYDLSHVVVLYDKLSEYILKCQFKNVPPKILVTYDSFRLVRDYLEKHNLFKQFHIVVDEWQSIFIDSRFKSSSEIEFLNYLQGIDKLCFVSATPMIDEYLKMMDEFKDLPYFEFDWESDDPLRVSCPDLKVRVAKSVQSSAKAIIDEYKSGKFEEYLYKDESGNVKTVVSNEAVLFVNSVTNIVSIISGNSLIPEECNILCARTPQNETFIKRRLGSKYKIGSIPLKGEPHKMFTFCTRTVYLGADFYSTCARTFIFSDANIDSLAVDISLDLPQILGRQRLLENPWKNRAELYYKTSRTIKTKEEFDKIIEIKKRQTVKLLEGYNEISDDKKDAFIDKFLNDKTNYRDDYLSVNRHAGSNPIPVFNNLVLISEQRAFDIQQIDYKDRFSVFNTLKESELINKGSGQVISDFLSHFNSLPGFYEKMKYLCEAKITDNERFVVLDQIPLTYKTYYDTLGPNRMRANGYNKTNIAREFSLLKVDANDLSVTIDLYFKVGESYLNADIKNSLKTIYGGLNYKKSAKATDLENWFDLKPCIITNKETGKREHGFKIMKRR